MSKITLAKWLTVAGGTFHLLAAVSLLGAPKWFFDVFAPFSPFNRHYMGDLGTFLIPLSIGLIVAARDPVRHRLVLAIGAAASVLHTLNHLYDGVMGHTHGSAVIDVLQVGVIAVALLVAYTLATPRHEDAPLPSAVEVTTGTE